MKKTNMFRTAAFVMLLLSSMTMVLSSCEKEEDEHIPPTLTLKTGSGYTAANATAYVTDSIKVGVIVTKTEDDLNTFNVSFTTDTTATGTTTISNDVISGDPSTYDHDYTVQVALAGSHSYIKYFFTITDHDGNTTQKAITVVVN